MQPSVSRKWKAGGIGVGAIVAIVLRWVDLGRESIWFDEGMSWWLASLPPAEMLRTIRGDVAAPVYFLLLRGWTALFGDSSTAMRALSALAATLVLGPVWYVARGSLRSPLSVGVAWTMAAVSFMQVQYARDARYYALMTLFATLALAATMRLASRRSWGVIALFVACGVGGLYTHNMMMFCLVGLNAAWLLWPGERLARQRLGDLCIANVTIALLYLPWVPTLLQQMKWMTGSFWATRPSLFDLGVTVAAISGVDVYAAPGFAWQTLGIGMTAGGVSAFASLCVLLLVAIGLTTTDSTQGRTAMALAAFALLPVGLVFIYSQVRQPIFLERVFIASSAVLPILLALSPDGARRRPAIRIIAGALVAALLLLGTISTATLLTGERKEDWRGAYATVAALPPSDRRLIVFNANEGELPFAFYAVRDAGRLAEPRTGTPGGFFDLDPPKTIRRVTTDGDLAALRRQVDSGAWDEIVLVLSHDAFADPDGRTEAELRARWNVIDETRLRLVRVVRFRRR
jgi:uncharacterized membrane protein